jgi:UMP-CMP kinase
MHTTTSDSQARSKTFKVIGMLGGPGSGKGTQCKLLAQAFKIDHISIGDVLREELKREGSEYATIIEQNMRAGTVGPKEITIGILKSHILEAARGGTELFILDGMCVIALLFAKPRLDVVEQSSDTAKPAGFPRNIEQAQFFEETVGPIDFVIVLECSDAILTDRLLPRERFDDNLDNIRKRIRTFHSSTSQVIDSFRIRGKVKAINADNTVELINEQLVEILKAREVASLESGQPTDS